MVNSLKEHEIKLSPSILNIPLNEVNEKIEKIKQHIDYIHIDVMDGKFVTNCTDGEKMFDVASKTEKKPLDVHLMVENPLEEIEKYKGAEIITFHIESVNSKEEALNVIKRIKELNAKAGISIRPKTSVSKITSLLDKLDLVLVMTVEPGYGGQKLIFEALDKIKELRDMGFKRLIEVDGGITTENSIQVRKTDVDIIVAGTAIFNADNIYEAIAKIKGET